VIRGTFVALLTAGTVGLTIGPLAFPAGSAKASSDPRLDPANFVDVIDNRYFPLPVGRVLVYTGVKDGQTQTDTVTVMNQTRVVQGITARVVMDVATHNGKPLEQTTDWYAQDKLGNVWYLGEATAHYLANGKVDRSGSWEAGVDGAKAGIVMEADPRIPDSYRQEYLAGQAEDTAWVVYRGGTVTVPYGRIQHDLVTLETTRLEPGAVDRKVYGPGIGIVLERAIAGDAEFAELVSVTGP
jgi:hypothetical protein